MTTTIEISDAQREALETLKHGSKESIKDVLQRLIDNYDDESVAVSRAEAREIAREQVTDMVTHKALQR